jgi:polar amino acid transport system substrate-binding protein
MNRANKIAWGVIGVIVLAGASGFSGAKISGGSSSTSAQTSFLQKIQEAGVLTVGCASSPPTVTQESNGSWTGPDLIPLEQLAADMHVKFEPVSTTWQNMVTGLEAGKYDVAADLDATTTRALAISYTDPVWTYPGVFVVPANSSARTSQAILNAGKPISVAAGSAEDLALEPVNANETKLPDWPHAFLALQSGRVASEFADLGDAEIQVKQDPQFKIVVPNPPLFVHDVGYGVPANIDSHSLQVINIEINNDVASGQIGRAFTATGYIPSTSQLGNMLLSAQSASLWEGTSPLRPIRGTGVSSHPSFRSCSKASSLRCSSPSSPSWSV